MSDAKAELEALCQAHGWLTADVARLTGVDQRTVQRWMKGQNSVLEPALRLLIAVDSLPSLGLLLERIAEARAEEMV